MLKQQRERLSGIRFTTVALTLLLVASVFIFYFWKLGTLTDGLSPAEATAVGSSSGWQTIVNYPINAPHRAFQYVALQINPDSLFASRLPSAAFMSLFLGLFYLVLKLWFGRLIGLLGILLLVSTPWVALIARSATPDILLVMPLGVVAAYLWLSRRTSYRGISWILLCLVAGLSLYVPGMVWLVVAGGLLAHKKLRAFSQSVNQWAVVAGFSLLVITLVPLVLATIEQPTILRELALIPSPLRTPLEMVKSIAWAILGLVWRLPYPTDFTVGRLPILSLAQLALATFGGYALWSRAKGVLYWIIAIGGVSILAAAINDRLTLLLPAVMAACVLVAAGLRYLYVEWNTIFPKNPLPRGLAVILMVLLVGTSLAYGYRYTLVAWPNTAATKSLYMIK